MRRSLLALSLTGSLAAAAAPAQVSQDWDEVYAWHYRPLVIFAPTGDRAALEEQRAKLYGNEKEMEERDMVWVEVIGDNVRYVLSPQTGTDADTLRERFDVSEEEFAVLLIGKDAGVKLRSPEPVTTDTVFALIDSMPMRRQEMREQGR